MVDPLVRSVPGNVVVTLTQVKLQAEGDRQRRSSSFSPAMSQDRWSRHIVPAPPGRRLGHGPPLHRRAAHDHRWPDRPRRQGFVRKPPKRVDFLLRYRRDFPLAIVEAKAATNSRRCRAAGTAYAEMLRLKFAYATNGPEIVEVDYFTGAETFRTPIPRRMSLVPLPGRRWSRERSRGRPPAHALQSRRRQGRALLPADRDQPHRRGHPARSAAPARHHGDWYGQDRRGLPGLLEAMEQPLEPRRRAPAPRSSTWRTAASSSTSRRTASSPPSAMPATRLIRARW